MTKRERPPFEYKMVLDIFISLYKSCDDSTKQRLDDDANDVAELGDRLTNILGAKRVLEEAEKQDIEPKVALRTFFKDVRNIIG